MTTKRDELLALADRVEAATQVNNHLDVLAEVALFKPHEHWRDVRSNNAGTKVIYTNTDGRDCTFWARMWTSDGNRKSTAAALRALADGAGE